MSLDCSYQHSQIAEEETRLQRLYEQIGRLYEQVYAAVEDPRFVPLLNEVHAAQNRINTYREQMKASEYAACCTACGTPLREGVAFCTRCGTKVQTVEQPQAEEPQEPVVAPQTVCPHCGGDAGKDTVFCVTCGRKLAVDEPQAEELQGPVDEATAVCPQCGEALIEGNLFCMNCGAKVASSEG